MAGVGAGVARNAIYRAGKAERHVGFRVADGWVKVEKRPVGSIICSHNVGV
jgi:hypothetical protein